MLIDETDALTQSQKQLEILMTGSLNKTDNISLSNYNYSNTKNRLLNEMITSKQLKLSQGR